VPAIACLKGLHLVRCWRLHWWMVCNACILPSADV
jgi:hypothetical protein